jgi:hypothetical protein
MVLWCGGQRIGEKQPIEQSDRELLGKVTPRSYPRPALGPPRVDHPVCYG